MGCSLKSISNYNSIPDYSLHVKYFCTFPNPHWHANEKPSDSSPDDFCQPPEKGFPACVYKVVKYQSHTFRHQSYIIQGHGTTISACIIKGLNLDKITVQKELICFDFFALPLCSFLTGDPSSPSKVLMVSSLMTREKQHKVGSTMCSPFLYVSCFQMIPRVKNKDRILWS